MLNYESFAVRVQEDEIQNLTKILRVIRQVCFMKVEFFRRKMHSSNRWHPSLIIKGFNETEVRFRLANVQKIWQRFLYRDSVLLEADRQKTAYGFVPDWAVALLQLSEDDAFTTFLQVFLHSNSGKICLHSHCPPYS